MLIGLPRKFMIILSVITSICCNEECNSLQNKYKKILFRTYLLGDGREIDETFKHIKEEV